MESVCLEEFLRRADLEHLYDHLKEHGMDMQYLVMANENELRELACCSKDKIKLRAALQSYQEEECSKKLKAGNATARGTFSEDDNLVSVEWSEEEWQFVQEIDPLQDKKSLKELLEHTTFGKALLQKEGQTLTARERKSLVQLIVEHQLRTLPSINDTIRQDAWTSWANEICSLFQGEHPDN